MPNASTVVPMNPYEFIKAYGGVLAEIAGGGRYGVSGVGGPFTTMVADGSPAFAGGIYASQFGAKFDGRIAQDGVAVTGGNVIESVNINITSSDVGKRAICTGLYPAGVFTGLSGTITSVLSASTFTVDETMAGLSITSSGYVVVATDDSDAILAALNAAANNADRSLSSYAGPSITQLAGTVVLPAGIAAISKTITVPDGVLMRGQGMAQGNDTFLQNQPPLSGTALVAIRNNGVFQGTTCAVQVGVTPKDAGNGGTGGLSPSNSAIEYMTIDGAGTVASAVHLRGYQATMEHVCAMRGFTQQVLTFADSNNPFIRACLLTGSELGSGVRLLANDGRLIDNMIWGYGSNVSNSAAVWIFNSSDHSLIGNHFYQRQPFQQSTWANCIRIETSGGNAARGFTINGNVLDGCNGHAIQLVSAGTAGIQDVSIIGNYMQQVPGFPDDTFDFVFLNAGAGTVITEVSVIGNVGFCTTSNINVRNILSTSGAGSVSGVSLIGNSFTRCNSVTPSGQVVPGTVLGNTVVAYSSTARLYSNNRGSSTFAGNGTTTAYTVIHNITGIPQYVNITPDALITTNAWAITRTATSFIVNFQTPLPTTNIPYTWSAGL